MASRYKHRLLHVRGLGMHAVGAAMVFAAQYICIEVGYAIYAQHSFHSDGSTDN